jgi:hypothetical protein
MGIFSKRTTRREFAKNTVQAAAMLTVGGGLLSGAESNANPASLQQQPPNQAPPAGTDALAQLVKERYGKYLSDAQLAEIKQGIERNLRTSERYSRLKLANGDEPDFRFHA